MQTKTEAYTSAPTEWRANQQRCIYSKMQLSQSNLYTLSSWSLYAHCVDVSVPPKTFAKSLGHGTGHIPDSPPLRRQPLGVNERVRDETCLNYPGIVDG